MGQTLFNVLISPLIMLMETLLDLLYSVTNSYGLSIIGLSILINTLISPFYALAEKWQNEEQSLLKRMKQRSNEIKAVFKGDERQYYLQTLYRHTGYSPLMSIRSSFGLLIQIPFFMAAYNFLSHYDPFAGRSFLFLRDLAQPDALLSPVNIMPFLMTGINVLSTLNFTRGQNFRGRILLFAMAGFFLVILYNSASGLLLYWTCNNIYSLIRIYVKKSAIRSALKNISHSLNRFRKKITIPLPWMVLLALLSFSGVFFLFMSNMYNLEQTALPRLVVKLAFVYMALISSLLFLSRYVHDFPHQVNILILMGLWFLVGKELGNPWNTRQFPYHYLLFTILIGTALFLPFLKKVNCFINKRKLMDDKTADSLFLRSLLSLVILLGAVIPLLLLTDAPGEIDLAFKDFSNMLIWVIFNILLLPLFLYYAHPQEYRKPGVVLVLIALAAAMLNFLVFKGDYGTINDYLQFPGDVVDTKFMQAFNLLVLVITGALLLLIIFKKGIRLLNQGLTLILLSLVALTGWIYFQFRTMDPIYSETAEQSETLVPEIPFSKDQRNTVILMMDRSISGAVPSALERFPELKEEFRGFTWYKNTISYGNSTVIGLPALLGGYEYTPEGMLDRPELPVRHKMVEVWTVLAEIFQNNGNTVFVSNPSLHNIVPEYEGPRLEDMGATISNLHGKYTDYWIREELKEITNWSSLVQRGKSFYMFSLFRVAPSFIREYIYDRGIWHSGSNDRSLREKTENWSNFVQLIRPWSTLEYLEELSFFQETGAFNIIVNMTTHEEKAIGYDLTPTAAAPVYREDDLKRYGNKTTTAHVYTNIAALNKLGQWFTWMQSEGIYDNTQIIIVGDHGRVGVKNPMMPLEAQGQEAIPFGKYQTLLMFKPFNSEEPLVIDNNFMTNADVAPLVVKAIDKGEGVVNPRTGKVIDFSGKEGPQLVGSGPFMDKFHKGVTFSLTEQYKVTDNSLDPESWNRVDEAELLGR